MRTVLAITALLALASPNVGFAESSRPHYTTLVVEFVGEEIGIIFPVVISTSQEEGNWYKQHLFPGPIYDLIDVNVVPPSVLNQITELPLLKRVLEDPKPAGDETKTGAIVEFTAGTGHQYAQVFEEVQASRKILKGMDGMVVKYPALKSGLHEIEYPVFKR